jgi:hypothetical protein
MYSGKIAVPPGGGGIGKITHFFHSHGTHLNGNHKKSTPVWVVRFSYYFFVRNFQSGVKLATADNAHSYAIETHFIHAPLLNFKQLLQFYLHFI